MPPKSPKKRKSTAATSRAEQKTSAAFGACVDTSTEVYNPFKKLEDDVPAAPSSSSTTREEEEEKEEKKKKEVVAAVAEEAAPPPSTAENVILRLNVKLRSSAAPGIHPLDGVPSPHNDNNNGSVTACSSSRVDREDGGGNNTTTRRRPYAFNEFDSPLAQGGGVGSSGNINRFAQYGAVPPFYRASGGGGGGGGDALPWDVSAQQQQHSHSHPPPSPQRHHHHRHPPPPPPLRKMRLLMEMEEKSKSGEWPATSSVHCYWCCHRFPGMPYGLPHRYDNTGKFIVTGCFCSLECAAAYNFHGDTSCSADEMWSRYSLINMLAARLREAEEAEDAEEKKPPPGRSCLVKQAPHRLSLSIFGGGLSIEEFRSSFQRGRRTLLHAPPMVSACQQVEEITDGDVYSVNHFIPVDTERIDRYQEQMRLKRNKPLAGSRKNIIKMMNIHFTDEKKHP